MCNPFNIPKPIVKLEATEEELVQHIEALQTPLKQYLGILDNAILAIRRGTNSSTKDQESILPQTDQSYIKPPEAKQPKQTERKPGEPDSEKLEKLSKQSIVPPFGYDSKHSDKQVSD